MNDLNTQLRLAVYYLSRLGLPGLLGLAMLLAAAMAYPTYVRPAQDEQAALELQVKKAAAEAERLAALDPSEVEYSPAEQLYMFYKGFPSESSTPEWLEKIYALAKKTELQLDSGEYTLQRAQVGRVNQYRITFPIKGAYPNIRRFITDTLATAPAIALDSIRFKREKVEDGSVEARVVFILHLEPAQ